MTMRTDETGRDAISEDQEQVQPQQEPTPIIDDPTASDESEILGLQEAIGKVLGKIHWHEEQIGELKEDIKGHEDQIEELRASLKKHVGPLISQSLANGSVRKSAPLAAGKRHNPGEIATGDLIVETLQKSPKPLDTKAIKDFLEKRGNHTNPSVELSRLVKRGRIERSGRGLYQLRK